MSFEERLRNLRYTSPSGRIFTLDFDELLRSGGKKAPDTESPGQNGGPIQDLGQIKRTFNFRVYLHGADYDQDADRFTEAMDETGAAGINHPRWGDITGLVTTWRQVENFVTGAGVATFEFTFIEADEGQFEFPRAIIDNTALTSAEADTAADAVESAAANAPEETDAGALAKFRDWATNLLTPVNDAFEKITDITADIREEIADTIRSIQSQIDDFQENTEELTRTLVYLYRLPIAIEGRVQQKVEQFVSLYNTVSATIEDINRIYGEWFGLNVSGNLAAVATAAAEATTVGTVSTRGEAADIIDQLRALLAQVRGDIESLESSQSFTANYDTLAGMERVFSAAINGLISRALGLPAERVITLDREVTPLQLAWELYGNLNSFDDFMEYNGFTGDEIMILPRGKEVRWYV